MAVPVDAGVAAGASGSATGAAAIDGISGSVFSLISFSALSRSI